MSTLPRVLRHSRRSARTSTASSRARGTKTARASDPRKAPSRARSRQTGMGYPRSSAPDLATGAARRTKRHRTERAEVRSLHCVLSMATRSNRPHRSSLWGPEVLELPSLLWRTGRTCSASATATPRKSQSKATRSGAKSQHRPGRKRSHCTSTWASSPTLGRLSTKRCPQHRTARSLDRRTRCRMISPGLPVSPNFYCRPALSMLSPSSRLAVDT